MDVIERLQTLLLLVAQIEGQPTNAANKQRAATLMKHLIAVIQELRQHNCHVARTYPTTDPNAHLGAARE